MKRLLHLFNTHPSSVGEGYWEHMATSLSFAWSMLLAGGALLVHAIFPFLCTNTGSSAITRLHERMVVHRRRISARQTKV